MAVKHWESQSSQRNSKNLDSLQFSSEFIIARAQQIDDGFVAVGRDANVLVCL